MYTIPMNLAPQMAPAHNGAYQKEKKEGKSPLLNSKRCVRHLSL